MAKMENPPRPARQARHWKSRVAKTREQGARVRHYMEVRYEDLITDTEPRAAADLRVHRARLRRDDAALLRARRGADGGDQARHEAAATTCSPTTSRGYVSGERRVAVHELTKEPPRKDRIGVWRREMPEAHRVEFERVAGELC